MNDITRTSKELVRQIRRTAEMSAEVMRDRERTGGWEGSERVARQFDRIAKLAGELESTAHEPPAARECTGGCCGRICDSFAEGPDGERGVDCYCATCGHSRECHEPWPTPPPATRRRPTLDESNTWASAEEERDWWRNYAFELEQASSPPPSVRPEETGVGTYCTVGPANEQYQKFLLLFEDRSRGMCIYADEAEARTRFAFAEGRGWNCHLFGLLRRASQPPSELQAQS